MISKISKLKDFGIFMGGKIMRECEDCGEYCSRECYEQIVSGGNIMSETKADPKIMDALIEETEETMEYKPYDKVERPMHYTAGSIETIDYIQSVTEQLLGFEAVCIANAIKYISRQHLKNGKEDLKKAIWYLNRLIEYKAE
jgi:hypothetical protein